MNKKYFASLFSLSLLAPLAAFAEQAHPLPEDVPVAPRLVEQLKYPAANTNTVEVGFAYLYGDKFLSTKGISIRDAYFFSENLAMDGGLTFLKSSVTDEAGAVRALGAVTPRMYNPSLLVQAALLYQPVYGKFAVGSYIQHFKIGVEAGAHMAQASELDLEGESTGVSRSGMGFNVGLRVSFPFSSHLSAQFRADDFINGGRQLWLTSLGVGYRL